MNGTAQDDVPKQPRSVPDSDSLCRLLLLYLCYCCCRRLPSLVCRLPSLVCPASPLLCAAPAGSACLQVQSQAAEITRLQEAHAAELRALRGQHQQEAGRLSRQAGKAKQDVLQLEVGGVGRWGWGAMGMGRADTDRAQHVLQGRAALLTVCVRAPCARVQDVWQGRRALACRWVGVCR